MGSAPKVDVDLHPFEGQEVIATAIEVTKAGDGLSDSLDIDPQELELGEEITLVVRTRVSQVRFRPPGRKGKDVEDAPEVLIRVHTLQAYEAAIVPDDLVADTLAEQAARVMAAHAERDAKLAKQAAAEEEKRKLSSGEGIQQDLPVDGKSAAAGD